MRKTYFILILLMGFLSLSAQTDSTQVTVSTHVTKAEADSAYINNDIRFNLELARSKTVDKVTLPSEMFFITWIQSLINSMSEKGWAQTGIVTFILTIFMLALFIFGKRVVWKKIGFISAICFFAICIFSNIFASKQKAELLNRDSAIIMAPSVTVKSTPNQSGTDLFILHEGRKVMIKDNTMKEWKEIRLEDGNVGLVPTNVIEII